jgi:DNA-directed RNA polymerase subunit RPC12/RpoP
MRQELEPYRCRQCGATSYGRLTHRDARGVMTYSGVYRCSGCPLTFRTLAEWRLGADQANVRGFGSEQMDESRAVDRTSAPGQLSAG